MSAKDERPIEVKALRAKGLPWRRVAKEMGISVSTAIRLEKAVTSDPPAPEAAVEKPTDKPSAKRVTAAVKSLTDEHAKRLDGYKQILAHRLRGEWVPREINIYDNPEAVGMRMQRLIINDMREAGATLDDAERFIDARIK